MTTVSLIIPCYNDGAYLAETLASVFDQTRPPDEIIVVDDGSTDNSAEVARGFRDRIRLIQQQNQGVSAGRNTGIAAATGDLIAFVDADDIWPAESLKSRFDHLAAHGDVDCVFGLSEQFLSPDLDAETRARLFCPPGQVAARFAGSMLIRRKAYEAVGDFDLALRVGETMDWLSRLMAAGAKVDTIETLVMRRRIHGGNTVLREKANHGDYLRVLKAALDRKAAAAASGA